MQNRVRLTDLRRDTWEGVVGLTVTEDQRDFVAPNVFSIAESRFLPGFMTRAVLHGEEAVGFAMYGPDSDDNGHLWLYRLMIHKTHQGKGLGRAALQEIIRHARDELDAPLLRLGVRADNIAATALYKSAGFISTGQTFGSEEILELRFPSGT
ncbi:GNAT family N-acetyltransferase [Arthrobacter sp. D1-29]